MTTVLEGGEGSASRPGRSLPPGKTQYPLYRSLGGPQSRSGQVQKISSLPGFDPRTVQPVASRYTDWATRLKLYKSQIIFKRSKKWKDNNKMYLEKEWMASTGFTQLWINRSGGLIWTRYWISCFYKIRGFYFTSFSRNTLLRVVRRQLQGAVFIQIQKEPQRNSTNKRKITAAVVTHIL